MLQFWEAQRRSDVLSDRSWLMWFLEEAITFLYTQCLS
jgi:hypothetical protein